MTATDSFWLTFDPPSEESDYALFQLFLCFGDVKDNKLVINSGQFMSSEIRGRLEDFIVANAQRSPAINRLRTKFNPVKDGEAFLLLPEMPPNTQQKFQLENYLAALNAPGGASKTPAELEEAVRLATDSYGRALVDFEFHPIRMDTRVWVGDTNKDTRVCRFCRRTRAEGGTFQKVAHVIPEALGNKTLFLAEECDSCNGYFGEHVEPHLVQFLDIQRAFLGVKGKGGTATIKYKNGQITHDGQRMVIESHNVDGDPRSGLQVQLQSSKRIAPAMIYRSLCKMALSIMGPELLPHFTKTIQWLRWGEAADAPLPLVASNVVPAFTGLGTGIASYTRRSDDPSLPHVLTEFRLGAYVFLYVVPFSEKDTSCFSEEKDWAAIWESLAHYTNAPNWRFERMDSEEARQISEVILLKNANAGEVDSSK